jgi:hypothetical protein
MKTILLLLFIVLLSGCTNNIPDNSIMAGIKQCESNKGLSYIKMSGMSNNATFICTNGAEFTHYRIAGYKGDMVMSWDVIE